MTDDRDYTSQEHMTGWDDPNSLDTPPSNVTLGAASALLIALNFYIKTNGNRDNPAAQEALQELLSTMDQIDWAAMNFAQNAIARGEDLYCNAETNDVLLKYQRH